MCVKKKKKQLKIKQHKNVLQNTVQMAESKKTKPNKKKKHKHMIVSFPSALDTTSVPLSTKQERTRENGSLEMRSH